MWIIHINPQWFDVLNPVEILYRYKLKMMDPGRWSRRDFDGEDVSQLEKAVCLCRVCQSCVGWGCDRALCGCVINFWFIFRFFYNFDTDQQNVTKFGTCKHTEREVEKNISVQLPTTHSYTRNTVLPALQTPLFQIYWKRGARDENKIEVMPYTCVPRIVSVVLPRLCSG